MANAHRTELAAIKRFDQLIAYLRDHMGWPIEGNDFEQLTFEYTPEELGIDAKNAAKIQEIKRLRPLSPKQPWGIFFVKFEPKRLPVVALRRILSKVALKKRASANKSERQAWSADDLLFVSNYGEGDERQVSFAHFSSPADKADLPTLKVLGWDGLDTALHLDAVEVKLREHLSWPNDEKNTTQWRHQWRSAFTLGHKEAITTSRDLSIRLAELARKIRERIVAALNIETENGPLTKLMKAFQDALVHDLDGDNFADMYAQTIAYGLLSARITSPHRKTADDFAAHMRTNPFLRELMETFLRIGGRRGRTGGPGIDFDELGVSDVVELLDNENTNMEAVVRDFGDRNPQEDPVIHFYELFLKEYDAKKRLQRGVFYTPRSVVSYLVRSVDELLRRDFGLADGLADTTTWGVMVQRFKGMKIPKGVQANDDFVTILDPATGTGTFLVEAIDIIYKTLVAKWTSMGHGEKKIDALWNEYVPLHLLTRLHGYELLMAPYAIAHLKIGLKLHETGYKFASDQRSRIYLTNALEAAVDFSGRFQFAIPALAHEATAVNDIKRRSHFTVVIGNPPYSGNSANASVDENGELTHIGALIEDYKKISGEPVAEKQIKWLQDDYVKFMRIAHYSLNQTGTGIWAFITNHSYLDNPTFRGMRWNLLQDFQHIFLVDLHGNQKKKERTPSGGEDENVFDIVQGVGLFLGVKLSKRNNQPAHVQHRDLWGGRTEKYDMLSRSSVQTPDWKPVSPTKPFFLFVPQNIDLRNELEQAWRITDVVLENNVGFVTARDSFAIAIDAEELRTRLSRFRSTSVTDSQLASDYGLKDTTSWNLSEAREKVRRDKNWTSHFISCLYRPFDSRNIYYSSDVLERPVLQIQRHMLPGQNLGIAVGRAGQVIDQGTWNIVFVTRQITEFNLFRRGGHNLLPLYLHNDTGASQFQLDLTDSVRPNLSPKFLSALAKRLNKNQIRKNGIPEGVAPEDIFNYTYAVFYSPGYRQRYSEFLKIDFPRLPLPGSATLFNELAKKGEELIAFHLLESPKAVKSIGDFAGARTTEIDKVSWGNNAVWIDKAQTTGFKNIPEEIWNFQVGGYRICEKWLKDRKGQSLSKPDIERYQKIVVALSSTVRLMREIDVVIEKHGGWPSAFRAGQDYRPQTDNG